MTTARVIATAANGNEADRGPLSDEALRLITAELYRASAEAIAAFDPEDTLAARLEPEWADDDWHEDDLKAELGRVGNEPSLSRGRTELTASARRGLPADSWSERSTYSPSESQRPEKWDPNPPPD